MMWEKPKFETDVPLTISQLNELGDGIEKIIKGEVRVVTDLQSENDNSKKLASTAYVDRAVSRIKH